MNSLKNVAKGGWHPDKDKGSGKKMSARGDFKGINQVAGWVGKGKKGSASDYNPDSHMSAPISTLKDPAAFGPPPKHVHYHGAAAVATTSSPTSPAASSSYQSQGLRSRQTTGGLGAPVPQEIIQQQVQQQQMAEEDANKPAPPPVPYRANTTGMQTSHLPKPPVRRVDVNGDSAGPTTPSSAARPTPPPRLPPRQTEDVNEYTPDAPPAYNAGSHQLPSAQDGYINQAAASRLAQSGVSVPSLGIGSENRAASSGHPQQPVGQLNELQQRFARMGTSSLSSPESRASSSLTAGKKPPPPPPPKKKTLTATASEPQQAADAPPPVPLASKPTF